jgi:zinc protease
MFPLKRFVLMLITLAAFALPARAMDIERVVSPGGIEAWLVRDKMLPVLALEFSFRGGIALDPAGKEGRSLMAMNLLTEGAGDLDSQAFAAQLEDRAVSMDFEATYDSLSGSLKTLNEHRDTAIDLLRLAMTKPRLDAADVERVRAAMIAGVARDNENPDFIARRTWLSTAFPDHPYGRPARGTKESLTGLDEADLRAVIAQRLARDNLVVGAVGDITPEELGRVLDRAFGALPPKSAPNDVAEVKSAGAGRTIVVRRPVPQSIIMLGQQGIKRDDPDWFAASLVNYVLGGGGFNSRLMEEVREKRGLTYGIYTSLATYDHAGLVLGSSSTENTRAGRALEVTLDVWRRMHDQGPTAEELENAKRYLTGSFALRLDSTTAIARTLVAVQHDRLGINYLNERDALIERVTIDDARRTARRLLDPATLFTVVVGQPEGIAASEPAASKPANSGG